MTTLQRRLLGIATVASVLVTGPVLWLILFGRLTDSTPGMNLLSLFVIFHAGLFWIYYRNVFSNPKVPDGKRHAWSIAIFLGLAFGQLVYYWLYVSRADPQTGAP